MADLQTSVAVTDAALTVTDVTTNDASTSAHGFLKKLDNTATNFMNGAGNWAAPSSAVSLSSSVHSLSANVTMTSANTFYDGPQLTLGVGTWLLIGSVCLSTPAGSAATGSAKLWNGTTVAASGGGSDANYTSGQDTTALVGIAVIAAGTETWKVSCACDIAGKLILAAATINGAGNNASTLVAVKIV